MAKASKLDDYFREHNVDNLFKELTQLLVRRLPADPAVAIVEHLQKKFPKSFKTSSDNVGVFSKTLANSLQLNSITSPRSDVHNDSASDVPMDRRSSIQSQISGITTIPTAGSAFTDLLKQDTNGATRAPGLNLRHLVFANRLGQQVVKMGKDIRSDHDILEEEVIKPSKIKSGARATADAAANTNSEDVQDTETHEELSVPQLIKYKQQIRTENDRRLHREKLAELARHQREKDHSSELDLSGKPIESQQQEQSQIADDEMSAQIGSKEISDTKPIRKPIVKSKEEEEILNDENVFQPRRHRFRGKHRNRLPMPGSNMEFGRERHMGGFRSAMRRGDRSLVCKVCGNPMNEEDNQAIVDSQQLSTAPTALPLPLPLPPPSSARSIETTGAAIDDWFESASDVSGPREVSPWAPDDAIPPPGTSSTFRRNLFQPIHDDNSSTVEQQSPIRPLTSTENETRTKRLTSPSISESGVFARSPASKVYPPSSTRSIPSPVTKKHQTDAAAVTSHQLSKTIAHPSPVRPVPPSTLTTASANDRRVSGWSVREYSPNDSEEN